MKLTWVARKRVVLKRDRYNDITNAKERHLLRRLTRRIARGRPVCKNIVKCFGSSEWSGTEPGRTWLKYAKYGDLHGLIRYYSDNKYGIPFTSTIKCALMIFAASCSPNLSSGTSSTASRKHSCSSNPGRRLQAQPPIQHGARSSMPTSSLPTSCYTMKKLATARTPGTDTIQCLCLRTLAARNLILIQTLPTRYRPTFWEWALIILFHS